MIMTVEQIGWIYYLIEIHSILVYMAFFGLIAMLAYNARCDTEWEVGVLLIFISVIAFIELIR